MQNEQNGDNNDVKSKLLFKFQSIKQINQTFLTINQLSQIKVLFHINEISLWQ